MVDNLQDEGVEGESGEDGEKGITYIEWKYIKH